MTVPLLRWGEVKIQRAIGTSSACGIPIALGGILGFSLAGMITHPSSLSESPIQWMAVMGIALSSVIFAPLGAWLAHRVSTFWLTRLFALVIALIGLYFIRS